MKFNPTLKKLALGFFGIFLLLFIVLVVHIATAKPVEFDNATMQVSRIDFIEELDSTRAKQIQSDLNSIKGVKNAKVSIDKRVAVYFHDNRVTDSKQVYDALLAKNDYQAKRFVIPKELASKKVCPVMDQSSFSYKFSRGIQRIFN